MIVTVNLYQTDRINSLLSFSLDYAGAIVCKSSFWLWVTIGLRVYIRISLRVGFSTFSSSFYWFLKSVRQYEDGALARICFLQRCWVRSLISLGSQCSCPNILFKFRGWIFFSSPPPASPSKRCLFYKDLIKFCIPLVGIQFLISFSGHRTVGCEPALRLKNCVGSYRTHVIGEHKVIAGLRGRQQTATYFFPVVTFQKSVIGRKKSLVSSSLTYPVLKLVGSCTKCMKDEPCDEGASLAHGCGRHGTRSLEAFLCLPRTISLTQWNALNSYPLPLCYSLLICRGKKKCCNHIRESLFQLYYHLIYFIKNLNLKRKI